MPEIDIKKLQRELSDLKNTLKSKEEEISKLMLLNEENQKKITSIEIEKLSMAEKLLAVTKQTELLLKANLSKAREFIELKRSFEENEKLKSFYESEYQKLNKDGKMSIDEVASSIATSISIANTKLANANLDYLIDDFEIELKAHIDLTNGLKITQMKPEVMDSNNSSILKFVIKNKITTKEVQ